MLQSLPNERQNEHDCHHDAGEGYRTQFVAIGLPSNFGSAATFCYVHKTRLRTRVFSATDPDKT